MVSFCKTDQRLCLINICAAYCYVHSKKKKKINDVINKLNLLRGQEINLLEN